MSSCNRLHLCISMHVHVTFSATALSWHATELKRRRSELSRSDAPGAVLVLKTSYQTYMTFFSAKLSQHTLLQLELNICTHLHGMLCAARGSKSQWPCWAGWSKVASNATCWHMSEHSVAPTICRYHTCELIYKAICYGEHSLSDHRAFADTISHQLTYRTQE